MKKSRKKFLTDWGIPLLVFLVLYFTGWYKPLAIGMQRVILSTGLITPSIEMEPDDSQAKIDYNWDLQDLGGSENINLGKFRGKVIFLNYFATWCPPCVAEMPGIQGLYDALGDDPRIVFLIISRDENNEKVKEFMAKKGYTLPVYNGIGHTPEMFHSNVLPTTFIVSPDGRIVSSHEGMADYDNESVKKALTELASTSGI